ncbi:glycosyltransferase family 2 protein [Mucilaginibacter agri]|uniref:Glycosyltransferase n=1 Tax=Mucilaginibacter agri TaxID=2695265 RepID=A0A965ZER4_9SPHI|nr:glycosyltransferase family 2 protein [Mucilaginibacter agri]NCD69380.1 glycosyltransferase [Mucilaginibacter agri]
MRISVVMTTYNGAKYLEQQILSILNQTLKPVEIIVCDDRSTDGTVAILEKYQQQQRLKYFINEERLGYVRNFKKAVSLASPENYVALSDQDDEWLPEKLEKSAALLQCINDSSIPCMVHTDLFWVNADGSLINPSFRNERGQQHYELNLESLMFNSFVSGCTTLFNPELARRFADFPDDISYHDVWMALVSLTFGKAEHLAESLVRYRKHDNNASVSGDVKPKSRYKALFKQILVAIKDRSHFMRSEFNTVRKFYLLYKDQMSADKKHLFKRFLNLQHKPYIFKKLAYRKMIRKHSLKK